MTNEQRKIIKGAIKRIQKGWVQRTPIDRVDGVYCVCLGEAISSAAPHFDWTDIASVRTMVRKIIEPLGFSTIAHWNDAPERTQDEVIALLQSILDADPISCPKS
jgi:hypothetical protein